MAGSRNANWNYLWQFSTASEAAHYTIQLWHACHQSTPNRIRVNTNVRWIMNADRLSAYLMYCTRSSLTQTFTICEIRHLVRWPVQAFFLLCTGLWRIGSKQQLTTALQTEEHITELETKSVRSLVQVGLTLPQMQKWSSLNNCFTQTGKLGSLQNTCCLWQHAGTFVCTYSHTNHHCIASVSFSDTHLLPLKPRCTVYWIALFETGHKEVTKKEELPLLNVSTHAKGVSKWYCCWQRRFPRREFRTP